MKNLLLAGAAAATLIAAPAFAQQASSPPATSEVETTAQTEWVAQSNSGSAVAPPAEAGAPATEGQITVQGVTPAEALGAVDPAKLSEAGDAVPADQTAAAPPVEGETPVATAEATPADERSVTVAEAEPATEDGASPTVSAEAGSDSASVTAVAEAAPQAMPESGESLVQVAEVDVLLPQEVADVVEDGSYSTDDLVAAQLAAIQTPNASSPG